MPPHTPRKLRSQSLVSVTAIAAAHMVFVSQIAKKAGKVYCRFGFGQVIWSCMQLSTSSLFLCRQQDATRLLVVVVQGSPTRCLTIHACVVNAPTPACTVWTTLIGAPDLQMMHQ